MAPARHVLRRCSRTRCGALYTDPTLDREQAVCPACWQMVQRDLWADVSHLSEFWRFWLRYNEGVPA